MLYSTFFFNFWHQHLITIYRSAGSRRVGGWILLICQVENLLRGQVISVAHCWKMKKKVLWYFHATVLFILAQMSLALYHHYMKNRKLAPVVRSDVQVRLVSCHEASLSGFWTDFHALLVGRYDIARALEKWGGVQEVSRLLSLKLRRPRRQGDLDDESRSESPSEMTKKHGVKPDKGNVSPDAQKWLLKLKDLDVNWVEY